MDDIVRLHERALDEAARLVDGVTPAQLDLPTPCSEWDVRALLTHIVGGNLRWVSVAQGTPVPRPSAQAARTGPDLLGDDPAAAYRRSAAALIEAWQDPALLDQQFDIPFGIMPGRAALTLHVVETVTHGWDLARATGQSPAFDPDVVRTALHFTQQTLPPSRPPGSPFAAPVPPPDDAPEIDRLAAYLGRGIVSERAPIS